MRCTGAAIVAGALVTATVASGQIKAPPEAAAVSGGYILSNESGSRKCVLVLRHSPVAGGLGIGFPAHCKAALPVLGSVTAWSLDLHSRTPRIRFHDTSGSTVLDFSGEASDTSVEAKDAAGSLVMLSPGDGRSLSVRIGGARLATPSTRPTPVTAPTTADAPLMKSVAGNYALHRAKGTKTGCLLSLAQTPAGPSATVSTGCPDKGVAFFSAQSWSVSGGSLWLLNAKGQKLSFEAYRSGGWEKGAGQGEPLFLVRQ